MRAALASLGAVASLAAVAPAHADATRGNALFNQFCAVCHGAPGTVGGDAARAGAGRPDVIRNAIDGGVPQMSVLRGLLTDTDLRDLADHLAVRYGMAPPPPPPPPPPAPTAPTMPAVEFHNASLDHYFTTAIPAEIAELDAGTRIRGWTRTGGAFAVWPTFVGAPVGATPVCRFYIPPQSGDSHFYSASPAECAEVAQRFPQFVHESPEVMAVLPADATTGACPAGATPVYRLWNRRIDTNHRYTTDRDVRAAMIQAGSVPEGYGPEGVAFCAPPPAASAP